MAHDREGVRTALATRCSGSGEAFRALSNSRVSGFVAALLLSLPLLGCHPRSEGTSPQLVLLYATCSLNREFLSPYRPDDPSLPPADTPNLENFSRRSAVLQRHQTETGQSGPSFASIFTGYQAPAHLIYSHPRRIPLDVEVVGSRFRNAGYSTHSWLEHLMAGASLGYARGVPEENRHGEKLLGEDPDFIALLERLEGAPNERAFVMTNFTVTHGPYRGRTLKQYCARHPEWCLDDEFGDFDALRRLYTREHLGFSYEFEATADRYELSRAQRERLLKVVSVLYAADVEYLDQIFGEVLEAIDARGLSDRSVIVFTADHGEALPRDGLLFRWTHGMQLAPDVLGVPAMISAPGQRVPPGPYANVTRSVDILPTILSLANIPAPELPGFDLAPALRGEIPKPKLKAFSHTALLPEVFYRSIEKYPRLHALFPERTTKHIQVGLRGGDDFFQLTPDPGTGDLEAALYDVARDKGKLKNRFDAANPLHQGAIRELEQYRKKLIREYRPPRGSFRLSEAEEESRLRALGYIE